MRADQSLLGQSLANFVGNAVRHAGRSARILVSARADAGLVRIVVRDDGPGIAPDLLPHVFEKFVRARARHADGGEGSGLGLAIAKGIVEAHGGTIAVVSPAADGRGAAFTLALPAPPPETAPGASP